MTHISSRVNCWISHILPVLTLVVSALFLGLAVTPRAHAQNAALTVSTSLTASASSCTATGASCLIVPLNSTVGSVAWQVTGSFSATLTFEATVNGTTWVAVPVLAPGTSSTGVTTATAAGIWRQNVAGYAAVRVRCSAFSSGPAAVTAKRSGLGYTPSTLLQ